MTPVFRHGRLRLYLLRLLDEEPRHGYEVIRLLRDRFMGVYAPSPGTIYPRLARLEEEGLVTHDEENGRKVYRITEAGREELRNRGDELDELEEELSASVSDIVREVREDVRDTVRSLREELTRAAREMRHDGAGRQGPGARAGPRRRARRPQPRESAREARGDRPRAGAPGPRAGTSRPRRGVRARPAAPRGGVHACATTPASSGAAAGATGATGAEWGDGRWAGWSGQHDLGALRDFERLARDFVSDLRGVAWDSESILESDVIPTLRDILADTLDRIRTEVFDIHRTPPRRRRTAPGARRRPRSPRRRQSPRRPPAPADSRQARRHSGAAGRPADACAPEGREKD